MIVTFFRVMWKIIIQNASFQFHIKICNQLFVPFLMGPKYQCPMFLLPWKTLQVWTKCCYEFEDDGTPKLFSHSELYDLVKDLNLSNSVAELLELRLKSRNLLLSRVSSSWFRYREKQFTSYFVQEDQVGQIKMTTIGQCADI